MKKYTFEELLIGHCKNVSNIKNIVSITSVSKEVVLNLMSQVRQATLLEAATKVEIEFLLKPYTNNEYNTVVDKATILDLDKDSIEVDD